ncbi:hypothetical protein FisN_11Lh275 [Fistulifera solaris]|uniref:Rhodanese domain-containing protein n=1 Tax=Fistulifera solaris TaxID=1519565 RepID=A0A1Z5J6Y5_FISSO|nr:hypothetical protein FisN_11Lh275 [Fistulifera solaris]|eukprot:GAX09757.1 hypothetical protein FisN_11Lh275 [Fistulifera solaris]
MLRNALSSLFLLLQCVSATFVDLSLQEFADGVNDGRYNILVDVRTSREYENGHIPNSTLLENLASLGNAAQVATPADLSGCESCPIVVYDSNGARSRVALEFLTEAGFTNLYLFEGGIDAWKSQQFVMEEGTDSVIPPCTGVESIACSGVPAPTTPALPSPSPTAAMSLSPTYGRLDESRRLSAEQLMRIKENGDVGVLLDVREDFSGGHISGATLVGPLSFDNVEEKLASFEPCFRCSVVVYGESAANAIVVLRSHGFASHLYEGPSVREWQDSGNTLTTDESDEPACLSETATQFACEQQWLSFQNMPFVAPTNPPVPVSLPTPAPVSESTSTNSPSSNNSPTAVDSVLSSAADKGSFVWGTVLSFSWLFAFLL